MHAFCSCSGCVGRRYEAQLAELRADIDAGEEFRRVMAETIVELAAERDALLRRPGGREAPDTRDPFTFTMATSEA